jgi:heme/copper-type cytochrome/quinol oxidase subunit 4
MYATAALLIVCGIPATVVLAFIFMHMHDKAARLDHSEALLFGGCVIAVEIVVAGVLLFVAEKINKRRRTKNDDSDT